MAAKKGLKCSKNNFWFAIRNPLYCGKIFIPKYKDEESRFVKGQHEPIISEALFYLVQDILDGRGRNRRTKAEVSVEFPLKGFFICPQAYGKQIQRKVKLLWLLSLLLGLSLPDKCQNNEQGI